MMRFVTVYDEACPECETDITYAQRVLLEHTVLDENCAEIIICEKCGAVINFTAVVDVLISPNRTGLFKEDYEKAGMRA